MAEAPAPPAAPPPPEGGAEGEGQAAAGAPPAAAEVPAAPQPPPKEEEPPGEAFEFITFTIDGMMLLGRLTPLPSDDYDRIAKKMTHRCTYVEWNPESRTLRGHAAGSDKGPEIISITTMAVQNPRDKLWSTGLLNDKIGHMGVVFSPWFVPPPPVDLLQVIEEKMPVLTYLSVAQAANVFYCSRKYREKASATISTLVTFDIIAGLSSTDQSVAERRRRVQRMRVRIPQSPVGAGLAVHIRAMLKSVPLRRAPINQALCLSMPMVKWEDTHGMRIRCRGDFECVERSLVASIVALRHSDSDALLTDPEYFRRVTRVELDMPQIVSLPPDFCLPQITRLKLLCRDTALAGTALDRLGEVFPKLERLHLQLLPIGLLPLPASGFQAPADLRLTLDGRSTERESNVFVASHLITLPFSWGDSFFRNVIRLQMTELNEEHRGLALEQLAQVIRGLPQLKRLGTVSARSFKLLDITGDHFKLEELVVVVESDDVWKFFKDVIPLEQTKRRCSLKRLGIHLLASDGVSCLKIDMENALLAGWVTLATTMLHQQGVVVFSVATKQLLETATPQLAWWLPTHFSIDAVDYSDGRMPVSTPVCKGLPYYTTCGIEQPNGTLISKGGALRPPFDPAGDWVFTAKDPLNTDAPKPPRAFSWVSLTMVDVAETLQEQG
eukprot:TRINITY_DN44597_c0_g1_i1.p1 TRINITY_DN44597_c0_g1~~TRINITY_DN44597_c0_g1_i1.p1  ORF type:complete len:667 (-),score=179.49 TRINITY_DN44597_c0_g1_i1:183-2183(-)